MTTMSLAFNGNQLTPVSHNSQIWLTSVELAKSLGYADDKSVSRIFTRNKDEFTDSMTTIFEGGQIDHLGESSGVQRGTRIFSLRGCHLIAMFSRTAIAKEFRKWVLDILDKQVVQYGLKSLPPSPCISEAETLSLRRHIEAFCKGDKKLYKAMYYKLYNGYNIGKYDQLPAGKLNEALVFLGLNNIQLSPQTEFPEHNIITMTQAELLAHDEQVASEAVKRVQGELVNDNPAGNTITISLRNDHNHVRYLVMKTNGLTTLSELVPSIMVGTLEFLVKENFEQAIKAFNAMGFLVIEKSKLEEANIKQLGEFLA